eukprot:550173-Prymnesium_polylepis.1
MASMPDLRGLPPEQRIDAIQRRGLSPTLPTARGCQCRNGDGIKKAWRSEKNKAELSARRAREKAVASTIMSSVLLFRPTTFHGLARPPLHLGEIALWVAAQRHRTT